jgi:hypothetical protein
MTEYQIGMVVGWIIGMTGMTVGQVILGYLRSKEYV